MENTQLSQDMRDFLNQVAFDHERGLIDEDMYNFVMATARGKK